MADELEAGLARLEVDHEVGRQDQLERRRPQAYGLGEMVRAGPRKEGDQRGANQRQEHDDGEDRKTRGHGTQLPTRVATYARMTAAPMPIPRA